jgi:predicted Rossmann-fold nucleotide-binding protein
VLTLRQLGYHTKPIFLIDLGGYWQACHAAFMQFVAAGFADAAAARLYELVPDVETAVRRLQVA